VVLRIIKAAGYSWAGLVAAFRYEVAFKQEVALAVIIFPAAFVLGSSGLETAVLIMVWLLVLIVELINSAIEVAIDRISMDQHELSRRAKDIGSAAVFVALVNAVVVWGLILLT
jgi:diacylglycerol kinase (ATP)